MNSDRSSTYEISAIVVIGNRYDDVRNMFLENWQDLSSLGLSFELIYVLDGKNTKPLEELKKLQHEGHSFRIIQLSKSFGEATALMCGFDSATGKWILTLPAYYQTNPGQLNYVVAAMENADMVVARRWPRRGGKLEELRRKIFHFLLRWVTGSHYEDLGCGLRLFDRRVLDEIRVYGDQHRFLPVLAENNGFQVIEIDLAQSSIDDFRDNYRLREYLHRILDIFTVFFLVRFTKKPLRFFGMIGSILFSIGSLFLSIIVMERLFFDRDLADRPALLLSSLLVVLGLQVFSLGLLGELIIFTHARALKEYKIARIIEHGKSGSDDESCQ
jgi:glycosyltransferase involved in cell wall biosynthesis